MQLDQPNPVGTWQVRVAATAGAANLADSPLEAGAANGLIVFQPDHTVLSLLPGPGAGTWRSDTPDTLAFEFRELLGYQADGSFTGYAVVTQRGSLAAGGDGFSSSGQGALYGTDGTHLATNHTTTRATRSPAE